MFALYALQPEQRRKCAILYVYDKSVCKERFYYNFSHLSHLRDGVSPSSSSPALRNCGLKGILSASRHHFMEDVQKLNIVHYHTYWTLIHSLGRNRSPGREEGEKNVQQKKGDLLDVYIVMFMLMMPFWLFYSSPTIKIKSYGEIKNMYINFFSFSSLLRHFEQYSRRAWILLSFDFYAI